MKKYILLILLLFCYSTHADNSVSIETSILTHHLDSGDYNENNKLIGIEYQHDDWYFNASTFSNSYYNRTNTLGIGYRILSI